MSVYTDHRKHDLQTCFIVFIFCKGSGDLQENLSGPDLRHCPPGLVKFFTIPWSPTVRSFFGSNSFQFTPYLYHTHHLSWVNTCLYHIQTPNYFYHKQHIKTLRLETISLLPWIVHVLVISSLLTDRLFCKHPSSLPLSHFTFRHIPWLSSLYDLSQCTQNMSLNLLIFETKEPV